jgi:predicted amino acid dehydrogenase
VNRKKIQRLWREEGLRVPQRRRRKRLGTSTAPTVPKADRQRSSRMRSIPQSARVAVVTGASSGIGEATARALAAQGYRIAFLARQAGRIDALATDLSSGSIAIAADVTDRESMTAATDRVKAELGRVARAGEQRRADAARTVHPRPPRRTASKSR